MNHNVHSSCKRLDSALELVVLLNFVSLLSVILFGKHTMQGITMPALGYECARGQLEAIMPLSTFTSFFFLQLKCRGKVRLEDYSTSVA